MKIEITDERVKPSKAPTKTYRLHIKYRDIDIASTKDFKTLKELLDTIAIVNQYIHLLQTSHNDWCNIEPCMIIDAAEMVNIPLDYDTACEFFSDDPDYPDYMARPQHYKVSYFDEQGIEFKCNILP